MHAPAPGPTVLCRGARLRPRSDRDSPPFLPPSPPSPFLHAILSSSPKVRLETLWRRSTAPRARATSVLTHATPSSSRGNPPARAPYSRPIPEATRGRKRQSEHSVHARTARWPATHTHIHARSQPALRTHSARNPPSAHTPHAHRIPVRLCPSLCPHVDCPSLGRHARVPRARLHGTARGRCWEFMDPVRVS